MQVTNFTVYYNGVSYQCYIDENGMVWFKDEKGYPTNIGQHQKITDPEIAKVAVIDMLKGSGR